MNDAWEAAEIANIADDIRDMPMGMFTMIAEGSDRILVLDKGKIIEDGKYEELINAGGVFAELVERQRVNDND